LQKQRSPCVTGLCAIRQAAVARRAGTTGKAIEIHTR